MSTTIYQLSAVDLQVIIALLRWECSVTKIDILFVLGFECVNRLEVSASSVGSTFFVDCVTLKIFRPIVIPEDYDDRYSDFRHITLLRSTNDVIGSDWQSDINPRQTRS